ncbi:hypothetical protein CL1_2021 [Thermococcus cleftensis]|uniref:Uncharacterized protein n=2 Tax=Thermococcus cleftensis (strain DSM 27260 / KACC 17922 / CL1) TaxID=163003 RepID=I3ZWY0_THECF|nr:hypothetical protein CL1_2021 [Thermococcus cleftensis]
MVETRKCPLCGGTMIKAKGETLKSSVVPPWKSGLQSWKSPGIDAGVWICLDCGVVLHYIKKEDAQILKEEFEKMTGNAGPGEG